MFLDFLKRLNLLINLIKKIINFVNQFKLLLKGGIINYEGVLSLLPLQGIKDQSVKISLWILVVISKI